MAQLIVCNLEDSVVQAPREHAASKGQDSREGCEAGDGSRAMASSPHARSGSLADVLMAATAIAHELVLVTRNVRDVAWTGVACINPFDAG